MGQWLCYPCRLGVPERFRAGEQSRKWPASGLGAYITPAARGVPNTSEQGAESEVAHKWAAWLHNPCRLGVPQQFRAGERIISGPKVGQAATQHLPPGGSPTRHSGEKKNKWPTSGLGGYITPAVRGGPQSFRVGDTIRSGPQVDRVA